MCRRRIQQRRKNRRIILRRDHAKLPRRILPYRQCQLVNLRADPPNIPAILYRQPELHLGMAKERVFRGQSFLALHMQRRDVIRVIRMQPLRE